MSFLHQFLLTILMSCFDILPLGLSVLYQCPAIALQIYSPLHILLVNLTKSYLSMTRNMLFSQVNKLSGVGDQIAGRVFVHPIVAG